MERERPLHGVRVLDLTRVLSGPHATHMLCDLGADVIKVEPPDGDLSRFTFPKRNGLSGYFVQQNTGKRNISIDLGKPAGVALLLDLVEQCDVLVENFRAGVLDRLGLGYDAAVARNPRIIYASLTGFGQTGPWVHRRAFAAVVGADTGFTKSQGDARGGVYTNDQHSHADVYTGMECATAIIAALYQRERTGRGDRIDVSMAQTMLYVNEHVQDELWDDPVEPGVVRSFAPGGYPVLTAADGQSVVISGHPAARGAWEMYVKAMGRPQLSTDPRFADGPSRLANLDALMDEMRTWAASVPTAAEVEERAAAAGLAAGTLRSVRDICATEWAAQRHAVVAVSDRAGGEIRIPNAPWEFAGSDVGVHGEVKYRGEDNRTVLHELLGLDDAAIDELQATGVLTDRVPTP